MPAFDEAAVAAAAASLRLAGTPRQRHGAGARLGAGPGASLELHDHRGYLPGDDLRRLDWRVYARSDQLVLRRFRQEVTRRVEVLLDTSASMAVHPDKARLATTLAALLLTLAEREGARPRLWLLGARPELAPQWRTSLRALDFAGAVSLAAEPAPRLQAGSERVLVSDGLCPEGGAAVVRRLGREAGRLCLVQVLTAGELDPRPLGAARLEDVEGGAADLVVDAAACAAYRARLERLQEGWRQALAGRGAGLVTCVAGEGPGLEAALRALLRAALLEPQAARGGSRAR